MKQEYRHKNTSVSLVNYHFVFCPRYRRKIFFIEGLEEQFKNIVKEVCNNLDIQIIAMECDTDHAHLFLNSPPTIPPSEVMSRIKGVSGRRLIQNIPQLNKMKNLWTRSYFVSTAGAVSSETIKIYVEMQKNRY